MPMAVISMHALAMTKAGFLGDDRTPSAVLSSKTGPRFREFVTPRVTLLVHALPPRKGKEVKTGVLLCGSFH